MSTQRTRLLGVFAGLLALAVIALWLVRTGPTPPPERTPAAPSAVAPPPAPIPAPVDAPSSIATPAPAPAREAPPPWAKAGSTARTQLGSAPASGAVPDAAEGRAEALAVIQQELAALVAGGQSADTKKLDKLLADVARVQGSSTIGGVNIDSLRHNLAIAEQMKVLAIEIEQTTAQGEKMDTVKMQAQMAKLMELQAKMRMDMGVPTAAAATPVVR